MKRQHFDHWIKERSTIALQSCYSPSIHPYTVHYKRLLLPFITRFAAQLSRFLGWILVPSQTEPPAKLQFSAPLRRIRPGPESLAGRPRPDWQHGQFHQWRCGPHSSLQRARREYVHQPASSNPGDGAAAEQGRGALRTFFNGHSHIWVILFLTAELWF